jgi:hypothetical protein
MSEGGGVSAGRRISRVSKVEVEESQFNLENLFKKYCQGEDGTNETQFVEFATLTGLTGKKCSSVDCAMIFQAVKLGKKTTLNLDRFTEAVRKFAVKSELTYQEIVQCAADNMASRAAATTNSSIPAGVDPALLSPKGGVKLPEGTDAKRDSKARLDAFVTQVPNRKSSTSAKLELFMAAVEGADGTTEKIGRGEPNADETAALLATISADLDAKDALGTVEQLETAASVLAPVANAVKESNELLSAGKTGKLAHTCIVIGCLNAIDETVLGSPYCVEHEHHPVGNASFEVVRQVLIDLRESTGYAGWEDFAKEGWDKLETYTTMNQLGRTLDDGDGVYGIMVERSLSSAVYGKLVFMGLGECNLTGMLPSSLAKLDTLVELDFGRHNNLQGFLPAHMGSASCLPSLKVLNVQKNKHLGGVIDARFLSNSIGCDTSGCHPHMQFPFLSGVSLSSYDIQGIFKLAPKTAVSEERAQGKVAFLYPKGSPKNTGTEDEQDQMDRQYHEYTNHLHELWREQGVEGSYGVWLAEHCSKWCCWAETWLSELRQLREGYLFVFVTPEKSPRWNFSTGKKVEWTNKQSFETEVQEQDVH